MMRIFLTGATGFIGSKIVPELIEAGHRVTGMARSEAGAALLNAMGAEVHFASLEQPDSLTAGAALSDAVIHTAFDHDFSRFVENCAKDARAIAALGAALEGSDRPLLITSGTGMGNPGHGVLAREDILNMDHPNPRTASERAANALLEKGLNVSVVRLPQVHDPLKQGLISPLVSVAREKGFCAYVDDGANRWPACHVDDVARLYCKAIARHAPGARYHAVAEEGVTSREIAEALGRALKLPAVSIPAKDAAAHFGWMSMLVGFDMPASSVQTQALLDWHPSGPTLITDLDEARFV